MKKLKKSSNTEASIDDTLLILSEKLIFPYNEIKSLLEQSFRGARRLYETKYIQKKSSLEKKRKLLIPIGSLKTLQKKIHSYLIEKSEEFLSDSAIAYRPGKSVINNAEIHVKKEVLIKIDIRDFFPSITFEKVNSALKWIRINDTGVRDIITSLCVYRNELPQGAPTSPVLANIVAMSIDKKIEQYIKKLGCDIAYTRYADDLIFSYGTKYDNLKEEINKEDFIEKIISIIESEGFAAHYGKIKSFKSGSKQLVTGIVVNDKISLGREHYRKLRAILFAYNKDPYNVFISGKKLQQEKALQVLRGHLNYLSMVNKELALKLRDKYNF